MNRSGLLAGAALLLATGPALADPVDAPEPLADVPFAPTKDIVLPGGSLVFVGPEGAFDPAKDRAAAVLSYSVREPGSTGARTVKLPLHPSRGEDGRSVLTASIPQKLEGIASQSALAGPLTHPRATVTLLVQRGDQPVARRGFTVAIPSVLWACVWGFVVVGVVFAALGLVGRSRGPASAGQARSPARWWQAPLALVTTPVGGYSLSLTQVLIWTSVTLFGLVYVYWVTWSFLVITPQMVVLLGIGGGTAIATRVVNDDATTARYMRLAGRPRRPPRASDLVWTEERPDIFKFQMLVFTLVTAYVVLFEIVTRHAFPAIPDNLVALMGVSSSVYVGNKIVQKRGAGDARARMEKHAAAIEAKGAAGDAADSDVAALGALLDR